MRRDGRNVTLLGIALACALVACTSQSVNLAPGARPAPVCPLEGCDAKRVEAIESAAKPGACAAAGDAPCGGSPAAECTTRALGAWSEASDWRALSCVARMLAEACELGDARACTRGTSRRSAGGYGVRTCR